jgi:hypothetical protein
MSCDTGNWLWMSIEFIDTERSSNIHFGPAVPLSTMAASTEQTITNIKIAMFSISFATQVIMYVGIYKGWFEMPRHLSEDPGALYELTRLIGDRNQIIASRNQNRLGSNELTLPRGISTAFVEYMYIALWIAKDMLWSYGTGDIEINNRPLAIFLETMGLCSGLLAVLVYIVTAYIYRHSRICFLDCLTTIFWIAANYVWMSGEFFVRYNNLQLDDLNEGNDRNPRIIASTFFACGIAIQAYVLIYLSLGAICSRKSNRFSSGSTPYYNNIPRIQISSSPRMDIFSFKMSSSGKKKRSNNGSGLSLGMGMMSAYKPQKLANSADDDDEVMVLF